MQTTLNDKQRKLIEDYYTYATRCAYRRSLTKEDIHDAAVDTLLKCAEKHDAKKGASVATYISNGTKMYSSARSRKLRHTSAHEIKLDPEEVDIEAPEVDTGRLLWPLHHDQVRDAVSKLRTLKIRNRERAIDIFVWRTLGYTLREIGDKCELSYEQIRKIEALILDHLGTPGTPE